MKGVWIVVAALALVACAFSGDDGVTASSAGVVPDGSKLLGICTLPVDPGHVCKTASSVMRYGYFLKDRTCQSFTYLGCGGTANNFDSLVECRKTCEQAPDPLST